MQIRVLLLVLMLVLCCGATRASAEESVLSRVKRDKILRAAYVVYPPFVMKDGDRLSGMFIELVAEIARQGGFRIEYQEARFGTMIDGLTAGKYDLVVSGIFPTIPRALEVAFGPPLLQIPLAGVTRKNETRIKSLADLARPEVEVAVIRGSVGQEYMERNLPEKKITVVDAADLSRAGDEVRADRADIALTDALTCSRLVDSHPELRMFVQREHFFGVTVMLRQGDPDWKDFLDTSVDILRRAGTISRLKSKYKLEVEFF